MSGANAGRRLRRFPVAPEILVGLGRGSYQVIANPIPRDAAIVSAFYDHDRHEFGIILEHPSFDPVPEGRRIPLVDPPTIARI